VKPHLVIALGNSLMGDDGIAWRLYEQLAADPRLPADVELAWGGADLLACYGRMAGRGRVTLLDAILDQARPGELQVFEDVFDELETDQPSAHQLSAVGAVSLLRMLYPELRGVRFRLLAIGIASAEVSLELSPPLAARLPALVEDVLRELA
jgi:hydrogenase maturation protease